LGEKESRRKTLTFSRRWPSDGAKIDVSRGGRGLKKSKEIYPSRRNLKYAVNGREEEGLEWKEVYD